MNASALIAAAVRPLQQFGRLRDFAATTAVEILILCCTLLGLRLAAVYWGPPGFGEYVLFRRSIGLLQLPLSCSVALGITRYIAIARTAGTSERVYAVAALLIVTATLTAAAVVAIAAPGPLAALFFGSADRAPLVRALLLAVAGLVLHGVAYGMFRGRVDMARANILQLANIAIVPLLVLSRPGLTVVSVAAIMGACWIGVALVGLWIGYRRSTGTLNAVALRTAVRQLLTYGLPRVPGEFGLSALFALPVTIMAHRGGLAEAGFLGFAISLVTMTASLFTPLGLIILPSVASLIARNEVAALRHNVVRMTLLCLAGAVMGVALLEAFAPLVVVRGLGDAFAAAIPVVRLVVFAAVPFVCYVVLRNVLDAARTAPFNTKNIALGFVLFWLVAFLGSPTQGLPLAFVAGVSFVGVLSAFDSWRVLGALRRAPLA